MKKILAALFLAGYTCISLAGNFTAGNLVVVRVGTGSSSLSSSATPVFLDEYTRSGVLVQSIALPTTASGSNHAFALSGIATSEGGLSLSTNGQYLVLAGYDASPPTPSVVSDSTLNRVIARVSSNGSVNTSTGIIAGTAYVANNIRSATSINGSSFWLAGDGEHDSGGTFYISFGSFTSSPVKISNAPNNSRTINIFNNQLYMSTNTNAFNGVSKIGNGVPTSSGQTTTMLPGFSAPSPDSPFDFWFFDMNSGVAGYDVLYLCDDRDVPPNGGIYKYSLVGGTWVSNGNVSVAHAVKGLIAERTCYTQIYCVSGSRVYSLRDDNGYNQSITGSLADLVVASSNTKFRGIAFAPGYSAPGSLQASVSSSSNVSCFGYNNGSINITVTGGTPNYSYSWGGGVTSQNRSNLSPGLYTVTVTDAAGCTATASATISQPSQLNASATATDVSCFGGNNGSISLSVSGGTPGYSYNWGGGVTTQNRSNLSAGNYTVTVTDSKGCTTTESKTLTQPLQLSVNANKTDVSCNGGNNGSITISVSGGTPGYSYNWGSGVTTQNRSNLSAGTYTVTVTDSKGCTATASAAITQPSALNVSDNSTDVSCFGGNNGTITVTISGGTPGYSYNWGGGVSTQNRSSLSAGNYTVTVTDSKGCTATESETISQPSALSSSTSKTDVGCSGGSNGSIDLSVSGGTSPYSYSWSNGATTQDLSGLVAGTYNVTITDNHGCTITDSETISQSSSLSTSISKIDVNCNGGTNGSINLTVSGGSTPYSYSWSNGATIQDLNNLSAGTYNVTVNDNNGCSITNGATISQPSALSTSLTKVNVNCNGGNNGSIDLSVSGGSSPYSYVWSNGATTQDLNSLSAGTFNVTVTDNKSCTATTGATITQPSVLSASVNKTDVSCNGGSNGSVTLSVSGGTLPYNYSWNTGSTSQNLSGLNSGTYTVTVTDNKGCTATASANISQPSALTSSTTNVDATCGGNNGSIDLTVSGGTPSYLYNWSHGATTQDLSSLSAGTYSVTITDSKGCTISDSETVGQSAAISASISKMDVSCNGQSNGSVDLSVSGGTTPYFYHWSNGATTQDLTGLSAGTYNVTVNDNNGCSAIAGTTVIQPTVLSVSVSTTHVSCNGGNDGSITLSVSGGTPGYTYSWNGGATTKNRSNLIAGTYDVTVTDNKGCTATASATITQPSALNVSDTRTDISCFGGNNGTITLTVNGGTPGYSYNWGSGVTTQNRSNLSAGNYTVTVTDSKGCTATESETILQPTQLLLATAKNNVSCNGGNNGSIDLTVSGGTAPYSYGWSNGATTQDLNAVVAGTFTVTVTDNKNCTATNSTTITQPALLSGSIVKTNVSCNGGNNGSISLTVTGGTIPYSYHWSNGATTQNLNNLTAGTYNVTIDDNNGCSASTGATITQPQVLSISIIKVNVSCNGGNNGSIDLTITGGTTPYSYHWSNGTTSQDLNGLVAGTFNVTVTDNNSCSASTGATVTQPSALSASIAKTDVSCNGGNNGAADLTVSGGTSPYSYIWSNAATVQDINSLTAGTYNVTITDANSCSANRSATVTEPALLMLSSVQTNVSCNGGNNGSIDLSVSGGTAPYNYIWSNNATSQDINNLISGSYTVTITDDNACSSTHSKTITQPTAISISSTTTSASCNGGMDGGIHLTVAGGTPSYTFLWNTGATTEDINNISAGLYSVTVTDNNSCNQAASIAVGESSALTISLVSKNDLSCNGGNNGSIDISISGGLQPYSFNWSSGETTEDISSLGFGNYTVTVSDANHCSKVESYTINPAPVISLSFSQTDVSCNGGNNGSAMVTASGGSAPYSYNWTNGSTLQSANNLSSGNINVTVTDVNGCSATNGITINQPLPLGASIVTTNVLCFGENNGSIDLTVSGGTTPYFYSWSNAKTTQDISNLTAATYSVTVSDAKGCIISSDADIIQPAGLSLNFIKTDVSCNGGNNGAVDLTVSGGTPAYSYNWSNGSTNQDLSSLTAGTFNVTVTDENGCTSSSSTTIAQPAALSSSLTQTNVSCNGANTGSIDLSVSGGTIPYHYSWSNSDTSQDQGNLSSGLYNVTITDASGCSITNGTNITQPSALVVSLTKTDVLCHGGNSGQISLTVSGGALAYSYQWSNGRTDKDINLLSANNYSVTVTDGNNCSTTSATTINEPAILSASSSKVDVRCNGGTNGSVNLTVMGGIAPYNYNWTNGSTTQDINNLSAGVYSVTILDANSCSLTETKAITEPAAINISSTSTNVICNGGSDGSIALTINGGVPAYNFNWSNGETSQNLNNLTAGNYDVTVTDLNSCTALSGTTITQPSAITTSFANVNVSCGGGNDGSVDLTVSGGTPAYSYNWANSETTQDLANLPAGSYQVTITDSAGCVKTASTSVFQSGTLSASVVKNDVSCNGGSDGDINLTVSGGTIPYAFSWSNGASTKDIHTLPASTYTVDISDSNGCLLTETITINEPNAISVAASTVDVTCFGANDGKINLSVTGGTAPYGYLWSNGETVQNVSSLSPATFSVTVNDFKNCTTTDSASINEPAKLAASYSSTDVSCNGLSDGAIDLEITGGTAPYSFDWSNGFTTEDISSLGPGTYSVTAMDYNGCSLNDSTLILEPDAIVLSVSSNDAHCNGGSDGSATLTLTGGTNPFAFSWSNGSTTQDITGIASGTYSVTAVDDHGCSATEGVSISQPAPITITANVTNLPCSGGNTGEIDITVSGGIPAYQYLWSNGETSQDLINLTQGDYTVTVTDSHQCTNDFSATVSQAGTLQVAINTTDVSCHGDNTGTITVAVSGGTPDYAFVWSSGDSTQNLSGLQAGNYTLTLTDANGCFLTSSNVIMEPDAISVFSDASDITCYGLHDGSIELTVDGGVPPFNFNWSHGTTDKDLSNLDKGDYSLTITDSNACAVTSNFTINEPDSITVTATIEDASSFGSSDGKIALTVGGGTPSYSFAWDNGNDSKDITGLPAGTYCVTVSDDHQCQANECYVVNQPTGINESELLQSFNAYLYHDQLVIRVALKTKMDCRLQIFDLTGRSIISNNPGKVDTINLSIPVREISSSCYLVNIATEKGSVSKKVVSAY